MKQIQDLDLQSVDYHLTDWRRHKYKLNLDMGLQNIPKSGF